MQTPQHAEGQPRDPHVRPICQFKLLKRGHVPEGEVVDQFVAVRVRVDRPSDGLHRLACLSWLTDTAARAVVHTLRGSISLCE